MDGWMDGWIHPTLIMCRNQHPTTTNFSGCRSHICLLTGLLAITVASSDTGFYWSLVGG